MPDFNILQQPNFAQAALGGFQAGQALGKQKRLDAALGQVDFSRPETIMPILQLDPQTGASLMTAASKMADAQHETAGRAALGNFLLSRLPKGGDQSVSPQGAAQAPVAPVPGQEGDIVVTAPSAPKPDPERALIEADPKAWLDVQDNLSKLDDNHRKAIGEAADAQATVAMAASKLPYEQRRGYIQSQTQFLTAHGVQPEQIAAFDPTDQNIESMTAQSLGVKGILERADKDRTFGLQERKFDHDVSHDAATLGVSQGNLAVSQGQLSLSRQREGRVASGASAKAAGATAMAPIARPSSAAEYNALPKGARYIKNGSVRVKS